MQSSPEVARRRVNSDPANEPAAAPAEERTAHAPFRRIHVIINPASGPDRAMLNDMNDAFHPAGLDWEVFVTKESGDASRYAKAAIEAGVDAVAVYGGDGTVTAVAGALIGSEMPLAVIPGGTANAIAAMLGIPSDVHQAATLLISGDTELRAVDIGQVNDTYFLIAVAIGVPGKIAEAADREQKDRLGVMAYIIKAIQAMADAKVSDYHITLDNEAIEGQGVACVVANAASLGVGNATLAPSIRMEDGLLDVVVFGESSVGAVVSLAASVVTQDERDAPYEHWQGHRVKIETDPPQEIQVDGEVMEPGPIVAQIIPKGVRFLVPRAVTKNGAAK